MGRDQVPPAPAAPAVLAACRDPALDPRRAQELLCAVLGGDYAAAVEWLKDYAAECADGRDWYGDDESGGQYKDCTYEWLMAAARSHRETGEYVTEEGGQHWEDVLYRRGRAAFWQRYALVTGEAVGDADAEFFSCSC